MRVMFSVRTPWGFISSVAEGLAINGMYVLY
jgi:hypothetical protein